MTAMALDSSGPHGRVRAVAAASVGNALEWFDFVVYGYFAGIMAKLFFPTGDERVSRLVVLATFGVTFVMRPLGAIVLGIYADRHGRKAAFTLTIGLMMAGTALMVVTPPYAAVGLLAPLLIVIARIVQGISAGGEFGSATAFLAEQNPARRGFYGSWQFASQGLTTILATSFGFVLASSLTAAQMETWGWRLPFIFGLLIGPVAWYIRRHVDETIEFQTTPASQAPLREALSNSKQRLLISFGAVVLCTVSVYTVVLFLPIIYAPAQLGLPPAQGFLASLLIGVIHVVLIPVFGALSDRYGRLPICFVAAVGILLLAYPTLAWLTTSPNLSTLLAVAAIMGLLSAGYMGALPALMAELFPTRVRTTGLSISYSFGVAIFGGFAPFINAWMIQVTGNKLAPSFYLMLAALISLAALVGARRLGIR